MSASNNTNCKNMEGCNSCNFCYSCDSCYSCYSCNFCDSCNSCYSCNSCNFCDSCYSCYSCNFCYSCYSCNSCNFCYSCDSCYSCYSCDGSYGLRMSERMIFCLGEGGVKSEGNGYQKNNQIFNVEVTKDEWDEARASLPELKIAITKWTDEDNMTDQEKKDVTGWKTMGGFLKRYGHKEAWANWWTDASKSDKQKILDLPHFDDDIFEKITGIRVNTLSVKGTKVKIRLTDGQTVEGEIVE